MHKSVESTNNMTEKTNKIYENNNLAVPDLTYLREMAEGDEAFFKEIITHFLENAPKSLNSLKESALAEDYEKVRFIAHKLLPQLAFVGIQAIISDVKKIETDCQFMDDLPIVIENIIKTINNSIEELKKLI